MVVKKIVRSAPVKRIVAAQPQRENYGELQLPTQAKARDENFNHYTILLYGREKIGKSTLFSSFPEAIFFATEPGIKGLSVFEFNSEDGGVKNWDIFRRGVQLLTRSQHSFKTVVIDTADRAYDMALDWVCENRGIEYPGKDDEGQEDFGKSWRAVKAEFVEQTHLLVQAGLGVCFTSHMKELNIRTKSNDRYTRIIPSMGNQARAVVEALVDFFFYAEYTKDAYGNNRRILICEGDETIWAGARAALIGTFPRFLPLEAKGGYNILEKAFRGEYTGLDPKSLIPGASTTQTARDMILKVKAQRVKGGVVLPIKGSK
jgi:hypothetical protein